MPQALSTLLQQAAERFAAAGIESAQVDAEWLLAHLLGLGRGELASKLILGEAIDDSLVPKFEALVARRAAREPLQHLTGKAHFRNLELEVGPGVFVPRPETELIAQLAIDALRAEASAAPIAVDLGTGSGAIALAMATEVPNSRVYAVEKSPAAHAFTARNFATNAPQATLLLGDLSECFEELNAQVSVVASNPPYIPTDAIPRDPEVRNFDPELALYGGADGMDVIHRVSATAARLLRPGGFLVIEHADSQSEQVRQLLLADGWRQVRAHRDLTSRDRAVTAIR